MFTVFAAWKLATPVGNSSLASCCNAPNASLARRRASVALYCFFCPKSGHERHADQKDHRYHLQRLKSVAAFHVCLLGGLLLREQTGIRLFITLQFFLVMTGRRNRIRDIVNERIDMNRPYLRGWISPSQQQARRIIPVPQLNSNRVRTAISR